MTTKSNSRMMPAISLHPTRREMVIAAALIGTAGLAWRYTPHRQESLLGSAQLEDLVPHEFGSWKYETSSGLVLPPQDQLRDSVYNQLLTRIYAGPENTAMMLLIAYSGRQDGILQVHRPEVCYPASGYRLTQSAPYLLRLSRQIEVPSRFIVAEAELRREQIVYWTRIGSHFPTAWAGERLAVIDENLIGVIPDGLLVRISQIGAGNLAPAIQSFAESLFGSLGSKMKRVLLGI